MSPDSPEPTRTRRAWRLMSALGCVLAAASILLTAVKWQTTDARVGRNADRVRQATCAIIDYVDGQTPNIPNRDARAQLEQLARDMRATGIRCSRRRG